MKFTINVCFIYCSFSFTCIIPTNASSDGELTAGYLAKLIKPAGIKVTRLAHGLSVGADIDYADEMTLFKAVQGRTEM